MYSKQNKRKMMIRMYGVKHSITYTPIDYEAVGVAPEPEPQVEPTQEKVGFFQRVKNWFK